MPLVRERSWVRSPLAAPCFSRENRSRFGNGAQNGAGTCRSHPCKIRGLCSSLVPSPLPRECGFGNQGRFLTAIAAGVLRDALQRRSQPPIDRRPEAQAIVLLEESAERILDFEKRFRCRAVRARIAVALKRLTHDVECLGQEHGRSFLEDSRQNDSDENQQANYRRQLYLYDQDAHRDGSLFHSL
jgi:hypothetical protein